MVPPYDKFNKAYPGYVPTARVEGNTVTYRRLSMAWLSSNPARAHTERLFLLYSPCWMTLVGAVVLCGWYKWFTAELYMAIGLAVSVPCFALPAVFVCKTECTLPYCERYAFRVNVWVAILAFIGNHFITHYFYNVLGVVYTVPVGPYSLNGVPICMFLMTQPYFISYHIIITVLLRRFGLLEGEQSFVIRTSVVFALAYITAFLETWSISAFPHYTYPDQYHMYTIGSAFYAMFFIVTYNVFPWMDDPAPWGLRRVVESSLACAMMVMVLMDTWRLLLGGIALVPYAQVVSA